MPEGAPGADAHQAGSLGGEIGYGLPLFGNRFTGTPNFGFGTSVAAREYRGGWRLTPVVGRDPGFEVSLDAKRQESVGTDRPPRHGVTLRAAVLW